jgi:hypothetical protein
MKLIIQNAIFPILHQVKTSKPAIKYVGILLPRIKISSIMYCLFNNGTCANKTKPLSICGRRYLSEKHSDSIGTGETSEQGNELYIAIYRTE